MPFIMIFPKLTATCQAINEHGSHPVQFNQLVGAISTPLCAKGGMVVWVRICDYTRACQRPDDARLVHVAIICIFAHKPDAY